MSSSPASSPLPQANRSSPPLAFLVHSANSIANSLPPDVDNKPLARQKRRRTSKEDEDILKAEYRKNPKPDKATRLDIVSRVALGEKEVQIWFQNKRQNDRRRSRPLDSSSTPALMSSSSLMSDPPVEDEMHARAMTKPDERDVPTEHDAPRGNSAEAATSADALAVSTVEGTPQNDVDAPKESNESDESTGTHVLEITESREVAQAALDSESQDTVVSTALPPSTDNQTVDTAPTEISSQHSHPPSQKASQSRTSWISNRRSASFVRNSEDYAPEVISFPKSVQPPSQATPQPVVDPIPTSAKSLKRAHSFVRISTNEDGTARVVTDLDKTPSPPHPRSNQKAFSRAAAGLRRSYSAAGLNERLNAAREGRSPKIPRTNSNIGRSRDSRAWEFWCDPDTRNNTTLTTRAEQEGSGSAADAIGLLRANRKILAQNQLRQNTPVARRHQSQKMSSHSGIKKSRGPMQRASTSYGRLQSKDYGKGYGSSESEELPQTESDKENWEPEQTPARRTKHAGQPYGSQRPRQILGENTEIMSQSQSLGALIDREKGSTPRKGGRRDSDPEQDEELRAFMNGDGLSARTTVSSAEEAGCVEGLLKLSQGQWR
ncbi:hypothetical protein DM02DRAFT_616305 [Periconia macrospinosa]|uniref:Homeobox domain-containing protein n=1 Tax=Periconia macrospinosa TaxID=97972 RepID=A0A2V1DI54_9PLEO|nr:hypothetical protein DM02DRAFT_616305 [Periconia macrospinosa]